MRDIRQMEYQACNRCNATPEPRQLVALMGWTRLSQFEHIRIPDRERRHIGSLVGGLMASYSINTKAAQ